MATLYKVQPGDTVAGIAQRLSGNPALARNLVLSNPHKPRVVINGQPMFSTLYIGEHLRLPNSLLRRTGVRGLGDGDTEDPGGTDVLVGEGADAVALNDYLTANGCDKSALLTQLTKNFQQANNLSVDGIYGPQTQNALSASMGAAAHAPCTGSGGGGGGTTPVTPTPTPGGGGNVTPVSTLAKTGMPNWLPWALGIGAIVLGGVLVMTMQKKKEAAGHPTMPSSPSHPALPSPKAIQRIEKAGRKRAARRSARKARASRNGRRKSR